MTQPAFNAIAGTVCLIIAVLHALRLFFGWHALIGGWTVPMWMSWVGLALARFLAYAAFSMKGSVPK